MENGYLIAGLGNPGREYSRTRHNAGYLVVERLAARWRISWKTEKRFEAKVARVDRHEKRVWLCEPLTYMNASGEAIQAMLDYYSISAQRLLVVVDDADLPLGSLRLRATGSSGGHHGLDSLERHLGSSEYARLRVGIGRKPGAREITGHVLGRFDSTEETLLDRVLGVASDQAECWLEAGTQKAMNRYNGVVEDDSANEGKVK